MLLYIVVIYVSVTKNSKIELTIDSVTSEGSGVGRYNGMAVFVRNTVPQDKIIAHIIKVSKKYAIGILDEIIVPSPSRINPLCENFKKCGGCSFWSMTYEEELKYKLQRVNDAVLRIGKINFSCEEIIGADEITRYRNKAQYPVLIENGSFSAGFYAYKSHRIIPCTDCLLQPAEFENGIRAFEKWAKAENITSYDEKTGKGLLRHLYFRKGFGTGEIMACAVVNGSDVPNKQLLIDFLRAELPEIKSIALNINKENTNVILGSKTKIIWGSEKITDILLGKKFVISPESFYQVNHNQCEKLYSEVSDFADLKGSETVLDMYCGAGTIGLTLADKCKRLVGVEVVPSAIANANENAKINGIDNAEFICADAFEGAKQIEKKNLKIDLVIVDPPRKGCQKELFDIIERLNVKKMIYVSCDSATLARDLEILNAKGYQLNRLKAVDMFPRTPHVECVALVLRVK